MMDDHDNIYLNALNLIDGIGAQKLRALVTHCGSAQRAWHAETNELLHVPTLGKKITDTIHAQRKKINPSKEWERLKKAQITLITIHDKHYPQNLKKISSAPYLLYTRGSYEDITPSIAVVGSRAYTPYGKRVVTHIVQELARAGIVIVSGLALGIDALAHSAALDANGRTVGILAGGVDDLSISPSSNAHLGKRMLESDGALLSEYPPGMNPHKGTFPSRNRIMAGMADAVLVVEAAQNSGTLITCAYAKKFTRPVFAVPGSLFARQSFGVHTLIARREAQIVSQTSDILSFFHATKKKAVRRKIVPQSNAQRAIIALLSRTDDALHIDRITKHTTLEPNDVRTTLTLMEVRGVIKNTGGSHYILL